MPAQESATTTAAGTGAKRHASTRKAALIAAMTASLALGGCLPTTGLFLATDPADPTVPVAPVSYRSTVAPYTSVRPVSPTGWRQRNDSVAPSSKSTD
jgi:hypothetical protein